MIDLSYYIQATLTSQGLLLLIEITIFLLKIGLLGILLIRGCRTSVPRYSWYCLLALIFTSLFENSAWILKLSLNVYGPMLDYRILIFAIRIAWSFLIIEYQVLALFLESLIEKHYRFKQYHLLFFSISSICCIYFLYSAFFNFDNIDIAFRSSFEFFACKICFLCIFPIIGTSLYHALVILRRNTLPKILQQQLQTFIRYIIIPHFFCEVVSANPFIFSHALMLQSYAFLSMSTALFTYGIYYATKKMVGLRFLNFSSHVHIPMTFNFINDFKDILEKLGQITNMSEITHLTQDFFKAAFGIPGNKLLFGIRKQTSYLHTNIPYIQTIISTVENFLEAHENACTLNIALQSHKILIRDEIEFTYFYQKDTTNNIFLQFLHSIQADVFLPIYDRQTISGYIIILRDARAGVLFNTIERDEMLVFASYLSNIIKLLHNRNLYTLLQHEKELKEELYTKHQEINQYKESIRSFLRTTKDRKIGIIFYKSRRFILGNQAAQELLTININTQEGHPLVKALHTLVRQVEDFKSPQTTLTLDDHGNKLVLAGLPNLEGNNVIILIYYPEIADLIKKQIDALKDPSKWDYLLYLETTNSGHLINQLIPGSGETLLNFKIDLLKLALTTKALLLEMPTEDLDATVEILHHISLRQTIHKLVLDSPEKGGKIAIKLFGINPIFGAQRDTPLLEALNNTGTLFIQNIHYLELETQKYLAAFIKYGFYTVFKSTATLFANVRIICSTDQNLETLVQDGSFSLELFNELKKASLIMPSLITLPESELAELADGFTQQAIKNQTLTSLLALNPGEKHKLIKQDFTSLHEFKTRVHQILIYKSTKQQIYQETEFNEAYYVNDPELTNIARRGKQALKDRYSMTLLWQKFQNQSKIALFLGVNRSSVNRRLKDFHLI